MKAVDAVRAREAKRKPQPPPPPPPKKTKRVPEPEPSWTAEDTTYAEPTAEYTEP